MHFCLRIFFALGWLQIDSSKCLRKCMYIAYERVSLPVSGNVNEQRMSWHRRQRHFVYLVIYINIETYFQYMCRSMFTHGEMEMELHATYNRV